jgi:hypothetical protein
MQQQEKAKEESSTTAINLTHVAQVALSTVLSPSAAKSTPGHKGKALVQDCFGWGGVSDKIFVLNGRTAGRAGLVGPYETYRSDKNFKAVFKRILGSSNHKMNPEKWINGVLSYSGVAIEETTLPVMVGREHPITGGFCLDCSVRGFGKHGSCIGDDYTDLGIAAEIKDNLCTACPRNLRYIGYRRGESDPPEGTTHEHLIRSIDVALVDVLRRQIDRHIPAPSDLTQSGAP